MDAPTDSARAVRVASDEREDGSDHRELALVSLTVPDDIARAAAAIVDAALSETGEAAPEAGPVEAGLSQAGRSEAGLSEPQRAMLEFERKWWRQGGAKEQAIRDTCGLTPTRYYQALNGVLESPAAMRYDPALVHRLLRLRAQATRGRRLLD